MIRCSSRVFSMKTGGPFFPPLCPAMMARSASSSGGIRDGRRSHWTSAFTTSPSSLSLSIWASVLATPRWRMMRWLTFVPLRTDSTSWTDLSERPGMVLTRMNMAVNPCAAFANHYHECPTIAIGHIEIGTTAAAGALRPRNLLARKPAQSRSDPRIEQNCRSQDRSRRRIAEGGPAPVSWSGVNGQGPSCEFEPIPGCRGFSLNLAWRK